MLRFAHENLLIVGDNQCALHALLPQHQGKIKLAYMDPPFNTGQRFSHYNDNMKSINYLSMMRDCFLLTRDMLSLDGSIWVHCNDAEQHQLRILLDSVFGPKNFVCTVCWQRVDNAQLRACRSIVPAHDFIHVYSRSSKFIANRMSRLDQLPSHYNQLDETGRPFCSRQLRKTGIGGRRADRPNLWYSILSPDGTPVWPIRSDGTEGRWQWSLDTVRKRVERIDWKRDREGRWQPFIRIYPDTDARVRKTVPFTTWWSYMETGSNRIAKLEMRALYPGKELFPTPKPEKLMQRIIDIGSNPGDIVLDCFGGSGTTAAVAHKMNRNWMLIEQSEYVSDQFIIPRLESVINGNDPGGITKCENWAGGGEFRALTMRNGQHEVKVIQHDTDR